MRGTIHNQIESLFHNFAWGICKKRHELKQTEDPLIHSDNTRATYLGVWHRIAKHARANYGIREICNLTSDMVQDWLHEVLMTGIRPATIRTYLAAISKLDVALQLLKEKENSHDIH